MVMRLPLSDKKCGYCLQVHGCTHAINCKFSGEVYENQCTPEVHAEATHIYELRENRSVYLTLEQIAEVNDRRCAKWHKGEEPWTAERWVTAIVGELGEMANITKKLFRAEDGSVGILNGQSIEDLRIEEEKEWADTMLYMILFASARGFNMSEAIRDVFNRKSEQLGFEERL